MTDEAAILIGFLREELCSAGGEVAGRVDLAEGRLSALDGAMKLSVEVRHDEGAHPAVAHAHVTAELRGTTAVRLEACVVGMGGEREAALADVARNWLALAGAPIFSLVHARPVLEADHFCGEEAWGVPRRHGFVGPVIVRAAGDAIDLDAIARAPLFAHAEELAPDANVHLAKVTLTVVDRRWQRVLEIDGHAASHVDDDWSAGLPAPAEPAVCTRFAVFFRTKSAARSCEPGAAPGGGEPGAAPGGGEPAPPGTMTLDDAIERFVGAFESAPDEDLYHGIRVLVEEGVEKDLADKIASFVPLAFARLLMADLGIQFSETYLRVSKDGTCEEGLRLAEEPVYQRAAALAPGFARSSQLGRSFRQLTLWSAELDAINNALHAGSKPKDLVFGPPVILEAGVDPQTARQVMQTLAARGKPSMSRPRRAKRWWQFWK